MLNYLAVFRDLVKHGFAKIAIYQTNLLSILIVKSMGGKYVISHLNFNVMENQAENIENDNKHITTNVETDYEAHQEDPKPAPTVNEPDNKGAGQAMKWVIPVVVIILAIIWFIFFRNNVTK